MNKLKRKLALVATALMILLMCTMIVAPTLACPGGSCSNPGFGIFQSHSSQFACSSESGGHFGFGILKRFRDRFKGSDSSSCSTCTEASCGVPSDREVEPTCGCPADTSTTSAPKTTMNTSTIWDIQTVPAPPLMASPPDGYVQTVPAPHSSG